VLVAGDTGLGIEMEKAKSGGSLGGSSVGGSIFRFWVQCTSTWRARHVMVKVKVQEAYNVRHMNCSGYSGWPLWVFTLYIDSFELFAMM
jgi:hypothetical protein